MTFILPQSGTTESQPHISVIRRKRAGFVAYKDLAIYGLYALLTLTWLMPLMTGAGESGGGNAIRQAGYLGILGIALLSSGSFSHPLNIFRIPGTILLSLAFCWLSITWSFDPDISTKKILLTTMVVATIFLLVEATGYQATLKVIQKHLIFLLALSFILVIVSPGFAIHQVSETTADDLVGNWKGIFGHKNVAGPATSMLIMMLVLNPIHISRWLRFAVLFAAALFLFKTGAKTAGALVGFCLLLGCTVGFTPPRYRMLSVSVFLAACSVLVTAVWINWGVLTEPLLQEEALTGRGAIWTALLAFWRDHHLGAGFGSFWSITGIQPIAAYARARSFVQEIGSGHNGYIDLLVTIGPIGLVLAIIAFAISPMVRILSSTSICPRRKACLTAIILYALTANFTETTLLDRDQPVNVMLLFAIALIGVANHKDRASKSGWTRCEKSRRKAQAS